MFSRLLLASFLTLSLLAACGVLDSAPGPAPSTPAPSATAIFPSPTPTHLPAPLVLRVWVTPRFDPASDELLQARLDAFTANHAGLKIEVRVKAEADLLESLQLTYLAAPAALPDLVSLPRADLESAAARGLIQPLDASLLDEDAWVPSARALGRVRESVYGLPFALDALALASSAPLPAASWLEVAEAGPLSFHVSDAHFPLALYLAADGALTDAEGHPALDEAALTRVLSLFAQGEVIAFDTEEQIWSSLGEVGGSAVGWASGYLRGEPPGVRLDALPGLGGPPATLVTSWTWAVAGADIERQQLAVELAEWLTAEEFIGEWVASVGFLSPRPAQRARWDSLLGSARAVPPVELMNAVAPVLQEAVASVLAGVPPEVAARAAVERLK